MSLFRGVGDSHPIQVDRIAPVAGAHEAERRVAPSGRLAIGTLACNQCDAPVAITAGPVSPTDPLTCPFCSNLGTVRDFLSLAAPTRPARVEVRVRQRAEVAFDYFHVANQLPGG